LNARAMIRIFWRLSVQNSRLCVGLDLLSLDFGHAAYLFPVPRPFALASVRKYLRTEKEKLRSYSYFHIRFKVYSCLLLAVCPDSPWHCRLDISLCCGEKCW
jgi:hypothetical protein